MKLTEVEIKIILDGIKNVDIRESLDRFIKRNKECSLLEMIQHNGSVLGYIPEDIIHIHEEELLPNIESFWESLIPPTTEKGIFFCELAEKAIKEYKGPFDTIIHLGPSRNITRCMEDKELLCRKHPKFFDGEEYLLRTEADTIPNDILDTIKYSGNIGSLDYFIKHEVKWELVSHIFNIYSFDEYYKERQKRGLAGTLENEKAMVDKKRNDFYNLCTVYWGNTEALNFMSKKESETVRKYVEELKVSKFRLPDELVDILISSHSNAEQLTNFPKQRAILKNILDNLNPSKASIRKAFNSVTTIEKGWFGKKREYISNPMLLEILIEKVDMSFMCEEGLVTSELLPSFIIHQPNMSDEFIVDAYCNHKELPWTQIIKELNLSRYPKFIRHLIDDGHITIVKVSIVYSKERKEFINLDNLGEFDELQDFIIENLLDEIGTLDILELYAQMPLSEN